MSKKEYLRYGVQGNFLVGIVVYVFYHNWFLVLLFSPLSLIYMVYKRKELKDLRKQKLQSEFKDSMLVISASLRAGYAIENAVSAAAYEMAIMNGSHCMMVKELLYMSEQIKLNRSIESLLLEFGERSDIQDIKNFAKVIAVAKRSGGEVVPIISHTTQIIREKTQVMEDIYAITLAKRIEQKIMSAIPILIVCYLMITSPGYFDSMYNQMAGKIIMSVFLILYLVAIWLSKKIMNIEV